MSRYVSGTDFDYLYLAKFTDTYAHPDGSVKTTTYFNGPYTEVRSARRQANERKRRIDQDTKNNRIGPQATPQYGGQVFLSATAEVVRVPVVLESEPW